MSRSQKPSVSFITKAAASSNVGAALASAFQQYDDVSFGVCAAASLWRAMETGTTMFSWIRSWTVRGIVRQDIEDMLRRTGAHLLKVEISGSGGWSTTAVWKDASVYLQCTGGRSARYYRRVHLDGRQRRTGASSVMTLRMQFFSDEEKDSRFEEISKIARRHSVSAAERIKRRVYVLGSTEHGLTLKPVGSIEETLERGNYTSAVLDAFDHVALDLSSGDPCGRLVIIHGPPGTGKTFLVRGLIESVRGVRFVLVPGALVSQLTSPGMVDLLSSQKTTTCLIVEDADNLLLERQVDTMAGISTLLNLAAGILGALSDVRIICTTNAVELKEFDPAILRTERLCRRIEIPVLSAEHASQVFDRLTGEKGAHNKPCSLSDVYREARRLGFAEDAKEKDSDLNR